MLVGRLETIGRDRPFFLGRNTMAEEKSYHLTYEKLQRLTQHETVNLNDNTLLIPTTTKFPLKNFDGYTGTLDPPIPLPLSELIDLLRNHHNISFNKTEKEKAELLLPYIGYGRLASFSLNTSQEISFTSLLQLYNIDRYLRNSISRLMPTIEITLKNKLSQAIVNFHNKNDAFLYEKTDSEIWIQDPKKQAIKDNWLAFSIETILSIYKTRSSLKAALNKYQGHLPIWFLLDNLTFGSVSKLLPLLDKDLVFDCSNQMVDTKPAAIFSICQALLILRNAVYHNSRVLGTNFTFSIKLDKDSETKIKDGLKEDPSKNYSKKENAKILDDAKHHIFTGLLAMKLFYSKLPAPEVTKWNTFVQKLNNKFVSCNIMDNILQSKKYYFPKNWKDILIISSN